MSSNTRSHAPAMNEEQRKAAAIRAFMQKRNSLVEAILYNVVHSQGNALPAEEAVNYAIAVADYTMKKLYTPEEQCSASE